MLADPLKVRTEVVWLASGLNREVTGIERFALGLLERLVDTRVLHARQVTIVCDRNARWVDDVTRGTQVRRVDVPPWRAPDILGTTKLIHNFGHAIFPPSLSGHRLVTVCDWGPFTDRSMTWRARASWSQSLIRAARRADVVHYLNPYLPESRPILFPRPSHSFYAYPDTGSYPAVVSPSDRGGPALFVGTADARKRIPDIVAFAESMRQPVTLVGAGTEQWSSEFVDGRGRVSEPELDALYSASSALILVSSYEGFGLPILEAARRGIFSVVSPEVHSTLPSTLQDFCIKVDPRDPSGFDSGLREAVFRRGTARFAGCLLDPLLDAYRRILTRS